MKKIDLHVHSNCSDGTLTPHDLVCHAAECGLSAFALTDHDTTNGLDEALKTADELSIEVIPGIEFSTQYLGKDVHVVGLEPDWKNPKFQEHIRIFCEKRNSRNLKMIDKMAADGIDISYEKMQERFGDMILTRAHFARYLYEHGYVEDMWDAFDSHVGQDCKYYVPREKITPMEVTSLIRQYNGIPVLAHPLQYHFSDEELRILLKKLCDAGLVGMEVYYSTYSPKDMEYLLNLAEEFNILPGGGSDFHGTNKPTISLGSGTGNIAIPYDILENLRKKTKGDLA